MSVRKFMRDPLISIANHKGLLVLTFLVTIFGSAGIYSVIEPYTYLESLEWATYMATSTGLGSYGAESAFGQIFGVMVMLWGTVIMMSLITAFFVSALREDPNLWDDEEQKVVLKASKIVIEEHNQKVRAKSPGSGW
jgi:hypothetical protein